jgi:hypothetical protein
VKIIIHSSNKKINKNIKSKLIFSNKIPFLFKRVKSILILYENKIQLFEDPTSLDTMINRQNVKNKTI